MIFLHDFLAPPRQERAEASARKRRTSNAKWNRKRAKQAASEKLKSTVADLQAQVEAVRREARAAQAAADSRNDEVAELTAHKARLENALEIESAAWKSKFADKAAEAQRYREKYYAVEERMAELEDELEELKASEECAAVMKARREQSAEDEAYDEEDTGESKSRQHSHEVREAVMMILALGISPSKVIPALCVGTTWEARFGSAPPKLRWIQNECKELRVVNCILAASTAADPQVYLLRSLACGLGHFLTPTFVPPPPQVSWVAFTHDGSKVGDRQEVTASLRLMKRMDTDSAGRTMDLSLGSILTDSGTAAGEVAALEERMFRRYRGWLALWRKVFEELFPGEACPHIPDPAGFDWHRLHGGSATVSDACNQAQAMNAKIREVVTAKYIETIGQEAWDALGEDGQAETVRVYEMYCPDEGREGARRKQGVLRHASVEYRGRGRR
jgi:hypothetical protein